MYLFPKLISRCAFTLFRFLHGTLKFTCLFWKEWNKNQPLIVLHMVPIHAYLIILWHWLSSCYWKVKERPLLNSINWFTMSRLVGHMIMMNTEQAVSGAWLIKNKPEWCIHIGTTTVHTKWWLWTHRLNNMYWKCTNFHATFIFHFLRSN